MSKRYSKVAIFLHWTIAIALAFQLGLGFFMPGDASGFAAFQLHKSVGITILLATILRLGWRLIHRPPPPLETGWEAKLATAVHVLFYFLLLAIPLTGWILVSTARVEIPTLLYGTIPWPHLPVPGSLHEFSEEAHELMSFLAIALIGLHVAGVVRHELLLRDKVLERMAPAKSKAVAVVLALVALAAAAYAAFVVAAPQLNDETPAETVDTSDTVDAAAEGADDTSTADDTAVDADEDADVEEETAPAEAAEEPAEPVAAAAPAAPPSWTIQPGGSLSFSVTNGGETLNGSFSSWSGSITFDPENPGNKPNIAIDIDLASASLGDATQDSMLKGAEFFATSANPKATFRSTSVTRASGNNYRADGTLSLKGVSKPQSITFSLSGDGATRRAQGSATIDRNAFGVGTGDAAAGLAGSVKVSFDFSAKQK